MDRNDIASVIRVGVEEYYRAEHKRWNLFLTPKSMGGAKENNIQSQLMILSYNCTRRRIGSLVLVSLGVTLMSRDNAKVSICGN